jgi:formyltetrahydrofolate hydrolase
VSKQNHCLIDLLWRVRNGELKMKVPLIISNHSHLENIANDFNAKFVLSYLHLRAGNHIIEHGREVLN